MATKSDLELAKLLLSNRILDEAAMRQAFEQQGTWLRQGRVEALPEVLYTLDLLPRGALNALSAPGPERTQPFANYRVDGILGEGGMSMVYAATYLPNGTPVALKVLKPIPALRGDFLERFQREARLLVQLEHEHVVAAYELVSEAGYHYFSMDVVDGATVLEVIERRGFLSSAEALSITWQVARALDYLHGRGLLHRDIKPGNVMVESSGRVRLIDLGLVGRLRRPSADGAPPSGPESTGLTVGTVEYVSPEQARGRTDLDPRSDLYSLGISLYHMVVGEVPFQGESDYEVMAKQILTSMESGKMKQRRIAPEVHYFIAKMSAKEREARFATLSDLVREVAAYLPQGIVPVDLGAPPRAMPVAAPVERAGTGRTPSPARDLPVARPIATTRPAAGVPVARPIASAPVVRPAAAPPLVRPVVPVARPVAPPPLPVARPPAAKPVPAAIPVAPPVVAPIARPAAPPTAVPVARPVLKPAAPPPVVAPVAKPAMPVPTAVPVAAPVVKPAPVPAPVPKAAPAPAPAVARLPANAPPAPPAATTPPPAPAAAAPPPLPALPPAGPAATPPAAPGSTSPEAAPAKPRGPAPIPKKRRLH